VELKRLLEAVLFAADRPVPVETLCSVLSNSPEEDVRKALAEMSREYEEGGRSFVLRELAGGFLFLTHPAFEPWVRKLYRGRLTMRLSRSALETIAVVAYRQPVAKQTIENIRGVNVDAVLHTLLERKLIRITGREEKPGRPLLYGTSREFLMYLGLNDLNELPEMEEMKAILEAQELPATQTGVAGPFAAAGPFAGDGTQPAAEGAAETATSGEAAAETAEPGESPAGDGINTPAAKPADDGEDDDEDEDEDDDEEDLEEEDEEEKGE
jgi:segregation and condensation protein B